MNKKLESLEAEKWKEIDAFKGYYVSNLGRIKHNNKVLKPIESRNGYLHIFLYSNRKAKAIFAA